MNRTWRPKSAIGLALMLILWLPAARAQVQVAPETFLRLSADASAGYVKSSSQGGLDSFNFGLNADLNGYFYHPNFLQFQFSPYYNQGREYSVADFIAGEKGFSTSVNLFSGSNIPLFINYYRSYTNSGLYGIAGGQSNVVGKGSSDNLNINWTVRMKRLPTMQFGYFHNGGDYRILGTEGSFGKSNGNGYVLGAQYTVLGFALTGSYSSQHLNQLLPTLLLSDLQKPRTNTDQKNLQFNLSRSLAKNTFVDASFNRARWNTDAFSRPQDRRYDTFSAGVTTHPVSRLAANFRVNYASDLNALLIGSILPGGSDNPGSGTLPLAPIESRTRYLVYTASGTYEWTRDLNVRAGFRHGIGRFDGSPDTQDTAWDNTVTYKRRLFGGRMAAGYSLNLYDFQNGPAQTSSRGHSGTLSFAKPVRGWEYSGVFQYSTSDIQSLLPGLTHILSTEFAVSGKINDWRMVNTYRYERVRSIFSNETQNQRQSLRVALSRARLNLSGTMQFGSGFSLLALHGPQTTPIVPLDHELARLFIPIESSSFAFNASYRVAKRTYFTGGWSALNYRTVQAGVRRQNQLEQFDFHVRHWFRRLDCRAGFRRYHQEFSNLNGLYNANTLYFQISRHFDVF